ncbi:MAG: isocitrate dehydrogenase [Opitutus sp.]|nr:isocitrate dehydrogenase [Opitutus sp.]
MNSPASALPAAPVTTASTPAVPVTIARGDGIGPEIMDAVLRILAEAGARLAPEDVQVGEKAYLAGRTSGIGEEAWASLRRTRVALKAPITTPTGTGYKSLNVTLRKTLGLYASVRPCASYAPFVPSLFTGLDVVIIRENEEDTYAGIEHRQTDEVYQCLKLITRPGCERICRYAFDHARRHGRRKVTCMVKDNIMKLTDGLFRKVFLETAAHYPEIQTEAMIIDIGTALLATDPLRFDVVVAPNLYGDIISDVAAQCAGSIGLAGSANIGEHCALFEAVHGSAPDIAGRGIANPSGLLEAACLMLVHIGQADVANRIRNAWLRTLEDGFATADIFRDAARQKKVGTAQFAEAVISRLGQEPRHLPRDAAPAPAAVPAAAATPPVSPTPKTLPEKILEGVDVFLHWSPARRDAAKLAERVQAALPAPLKLKMIANRGVLVWPEGRPEAFCTDHWRCRIIATGENPMRPRHIAEALLALEAHHLDVVKTENLYRFNGQPGYSLGQGE